MLQNFAVTAVITLAIAALSWGLVYWRIETISLPKDLAAKGLPAVRREATRFYSMLAVFSGVVSYFVFRWMTGRYPGNAPVLFLELAIGIGILFTVLAVIFFRKALLELTLLHVLYIVGLGWLLPSLLHF